MLSERAKGKQRAIEPPVEDQPISGQGLAPEPEQTSRDLVVRFTEGAPDLTISVEKRDSVRDVKRHVRVLFLAVRSKLNQHLSLQIREARPDLRNRRLRLIHSGRLLTDGTFLYSWLETLEKRQKNVYVEKEVVSPTTAAVAAKTATTWIHCSVGPEMDPSEAEDDAKLQVCQFG